MDTDSGFLWVANAKWQGRGQRLNRLPGKAAHHLQRGLIISYGGQTKLRLSGCPSPHDKMQDQGDQREYQEQMDQAPSHMKHSEATYPRYQQHNE